MAKLKVYVTPIGFHDAYVAATSQKAALEAWGTDRNLFARGGASVVTDEALTREPLAHPGKVIKRSRGTTAEQLAALPPDKPKSKPLCTARPPAAPDKPTKRSAPSPDRSALDAAEQALERERHRNAEELKRIDEQIADLKARRQRAVREHKSEAARLSASRLRAAAAYEKAVAASKG
jgi:hypothetical protein